MSMKKCIICGWWFEPHARNQKTCDDECRRESLRRSRRNSKRKKYQTEKQANVRKKGAILKCDPSKLPKPPLPPTKEVRIGGPVDYEENASPMDKFFAAEQEDSVVTGPFTAEEDMLISALLADGMTITFIAKELHRHTGAVAGRVKKLRLREGA